MKKIIVHGASSFIGKNFIKKIISLNIPVIIIAREKSQFPFRENNPFVNIYRYGTNPSEVDLSNDFTCNSVFFEFAWYGVHGSQRNLPKQFSINVPLIISSVELAHRLKVNHWIGLGSQAEYGNLNKNISENDVTRPTTIYGKAKLICSEISSEMCKTYNIEHTWLRLFSVFGPDDNHEWLIQYLIKKMQNDKEVNVTKGEQFWDYLYIDDISNLLMGLSSLYKLKFKKLWKHYVILIDNDT